MVYSVWRRKFILGADVLDEKQIKGWTEATDINIIDFIKIYATKGVKQFFCADIPVRTGFTGSSMIFIKKY